MKTIAMENILDYVLDEKSEYLTKEKTIELLVQHFEINPEMEGYLQVLLNEESLREDTSTLIDSIMKSRGVYGFSILGLRRKRLEERQHINFDSFEEMFKTDNKQALQTLFLEPINEFKLNLVTQKLRNKVMTLKQLYDRHIEEPKARLLLHVY